MNGAFTSDSILEKAYHTGLESASPVCLVVHQPVQYLLPPERLHVLPGSTLLDLGYHRRGARPAVDAEGGPEPRDGHPSWWAQPR